MKSTRSGARENARGRVGDKYSLGHCTAGRRKELILWLS